MRLIHTDTGAFGRVVLDVCSRCTGLWLDAGELDQLDGSVWVNLEDHAYHETPDDHTICDCPRCHVPMKSVSASDLPDVILDHCPGCRGFWLDHGELELMRTLVENLESETWPQSGGQKPPGWSDLRWRMYQLSVSRD
jgi:Zn-finger nucleic acid-binding protein